MPSFFVQGFVWFLAVWVVHFPNKVGWVLGRFCLETQRILQYAFGGFGQKTASKPTSVNAMFLGILEGELENICNTRCGRFIGASAT